MDNNRKPVNYFGIASLVFGIVGILTICACGIGFFFGLIGVILGILGLTVQKNAGRGMPTAGLVVSGIALIFGCIWMWLYIRGGSSTSFPGKLSNNTETTTEAETEPDLHSAPTVASSGPYVLKSGTQYSFMSDDCNVYVAKAITDSLIQVERWGKSLPSSKKTKKEADIGTYKINDEKNGFAWVDEEHTAFVLTFRDNNNYYSTDLSKEASHVFTIDINDTDTNKGSVNTQKIACYTYTSDESHIYRAIPLTDSLIKIECWSTFLFSDFNYAWDWCVIDPKRTSTDFEWADENHKSFTITARDEKNTSYWKEEKLVAFTLENENYTYASVKEYLDVLSRDPADREPKNGFNESTNATVKVGKYNFSVPSYFTSDIKKTTHYRANDDTTEEMAQLNINCFYDYEDTVTFDLLKKETEEGLMSKSFEQFYDKGEDTTYEVYENDQIKGYLYKTNFVMGSDLGQAIFLCFPSEQDNRWYYVTLSVSNIAENRYDEDFMKILNSIAPVAEGENEEVSETRSALTGVDMVGINEGFGNKTITGKVTEANLDYQNYDKIWVTVPDGKKVVYIKIVVTNISQESNYVSVGDFDCYVNNVFVSPELFNGNEGDSYNANIEPGRSAVLGAMYVVPKDAASIELEYNPIGEYAERVIIKIQ